MVALAMIFSPAKINQRFSTVHVVAVGWVRDDLQGESGGITLSQQFRDAADFWPLDMPSKIIEELCKSWRQITRTYWG